MKSNPLVSIIIPTFNRESFIGFALDSILGQTYTNWECIVIDDGGQDNTEELVNQYATSDSRITFYKRSQDYPKGVNGARNFGLDKSKGDYIALCDDDDYWLDHKLDKQIAVFKAHPEVGLVTGNIEYIETDGIRKGRIINHVGNHGQVFESFLLKNRTSAITPLFKREVVEKVGKFNTDFQIFEDWEFWRRIAYYYPFYGMDEVLACVRLHDSNTSKIVTTKPLEQFVRYRKLNKATIAWGASFFTKKEKQLINKVEWQRISQILKNHCSGIRGKLVFVCQVASHSPKEFLRLAYLFIFYGIFK